MQQHQQEKGSNHESLPHHSSLQYFSRLSNNLASPRNRLPSEMRCCSPAGLGTSSPRAAARARGASLGPGTGALLGSRPAALILASKISWAAHRSQKRHHLPSRSLPVPLRSPTLSLTPPLASPPWLSRSALHLLSRPTPLFTLMVLDYGDKMLVDVTQGDQQQQPLISSKPVVHRCPEPRPHLATPSVAVPSPAADLPARPW